MPRTFVTPEQLAAHLTNKLRQVDGCENLLIRSVKRLRKPALSGSNWSDLVSVDAGDVPPALYQRDLTRIIREARKAFNLIET